MSYVTEMSDDELRQNVERIRRGDSALTARLKKQLLAEADRRAAAKEQS